VEAAGPDVYAGLNLLVRRKPKENNFKAILDCMQTAAGSGSSRTRGGPRRRGAA
jgi:hypothetical protein